MGNREVIDCKECGGKIIIDHNDDKEGKYRCFRCGTPVELKYVDGKLTANFLDVCIRPQ